MTPVPSSHIYAHCIACYINSVCVGHRRTCWWCVSVRMVDSLLIVNPVGVIIYPPRWRENKKSKKRKKKKKKRKISDLSEKRGPLLNGSSRSETTRRLQTTLHCRPTQFRVLFVRSFSLLFFFSRSTRAHAGQTERHNRGTNRPISLDFVIQPLSLSLYLV